MADQVVLVTGAESGFGRLAADAVAHGGHTVYAAMDETAGRNAAAAEDVRAYAREQGLDLRPIELDAGSQASVDAAVAGIVAAHGRIDVVVHDAGRMAFGPAEAFVPEQFAAFYDIHVLAAQRLNRAVLPHMRESGRGLLIWISASGSAGGAPPCLAPYFAAKAGLDALAVQYARELAPWGIETSIVVPGAYCRGVADLARADGPADAARVGAYEAGPTRGLGEAVRAAYRRIVPADADPGAVAGAVAGLVETPFGERPFRVHVDPGEDGGAVAFAVIDRVRAEMLDRMGLSDLVRPAVRPIAP